MSGQITVSMIVPIYNVENYLSACLDSIAAQDYLNIEVILVDDGSNDHSSDIAKAYLDTHPSWFFYHKENGGLSDARNYGIQRSHGQYCCFVDSDDTIDPSYVSAMVESLDDDVDMVICDMEYVYDDGKRIFSSGGDLTRGQITDHPEWININNSACNKLVRSSLVKSFLFPKGKNYEDLATIPVWISNSRTIVKVDRPLYFYRQRLGSIAHSANLKLFDIYDAIQRCIDTFASTGQDHLIPLMRSNYIRHGLDLTTLRIKDFDDPTQIVPYLKMNMDHLRMHYPSWRHDSLLNTYPFKKRLIFTLLGARHYNLVKYLYGKN